MTSYETVEDIPGVGKETAKKLKDAGYATLESVATATLRELVEKGFTEKTAQKLVNETYANFHPEYVTAFDLMNRRRETIRKLTTGCGAIDDLTGGLETKTINEFAGLYGAGKSVLCHQLCVTVKLPVEKGGLNGNALYLDTEGSFRPEWIQRIAPRFELDPDAVLRETVCMEADTSDKQVMLLNKADAVIKERNVKLVIIDSLMNHFREEYSGREELSPRQQALNAHIAKLFKWTSIFNIVGVVTNQVMDNPTPFAGYFPKAIGGNILGHASHIRTLMRLGPKNPSGTKNRIITLDVHLLRPFGEREFKITDRGIEDVAEEDLKRKRKEDAEEK